MSRRVKQKDIEMSNSPNKKSSKARSSNNWIHVQRPSNCHHNSRTAEHEEPWNAVAEVRISPIEIVQRPAVVESAESSVAATAGSSTMQHKL